VACEICVQLSSLLLLDDTNICLTTQNIHMVWLSSIALQIIWCCPEKFVQQPCPLPVAIRIIDWQLKNLYCLSVVCRYTNNWLTLKIFVWSVRRRLIDPKGCRCRALSLLGPRAYATLLAIAWYLVPYIWYRVVLRGTVYRLGHGVVGRPLGL